MIVVVEGPSAAGKTTWCRRHADLWLPEPGRWPWEEILRYQLDRWRQATEADAHGRVVVLDGDPVKLYYAWAQLKLGLISDDAWRAEVERVRALFLIGQFGLPDLVLYADPGADELARRKETDHTRTRRNFDLHLVMAPHFGTWFEALAALEPDRVRWEHPESGLDPELLALGRRRNRSDVNQLDALLDGLQRRRSSPPPNRPRANGDGATGAP